MAGVRWGIAGPGAMADLMARAFPAVPNGELVAVGSRSLARAQEFAARHGVAGAYGSYADLCAAPDVDAVYVATPHPQHADVALAAIAAGKAVLVEKAFTSSLADTHAVVAAARAAGVFCMEGMWTRCNPAVIRLRELIDEGAIGQVRSVHGDLTAYREYDPADRLFNPELGGGAVLDLGVYVVSFAQQILGVPDTVAAHAGFLPHGVEGEVSMLLGYADGRSATLAVSFTTHGPGRLMILGTTGWIDVHPRFHRAATFTLWRGTSPETMIYDSGYHHEITHVGECLAQGRTESPLVPLDDTIAVQAILDKVLTAIGRGTPPPPASSGGSP